MRNGSIVFVHGTGVRRQAYRRSLQTAKDVAAASGVTEAFVACAWGDPLGVVFRGKCLPDPPDIETLRREEAQFSQWRWLIDDPLSELDMLSIRPEAQPRQDFGRPDKSPEWEVLWNEITNYAPSIEAQALLARADLADLWAPAWSRVIRDSPIARLAFEASEHELPEVVHALARAVVAELYVVASENGRSGPDQWLRERLRDQLLSDWNQQVYALGSFISSLLRRAATRVLRAHRRSLSETCMNSIGDILLYQSRGSEIREFIRMKIIASDPPVTVVAHSLGSIACVDLLALPGAPEIHRLVTAGSQAALFYELGALFSLAPSQPLPNTFPLWLNLFDRNDLLSYTASQLWPCGRVEDCEVKSGDPFPDSHGAYFSSNSVWENIRTFIDK